MVWRRKSLLLALYLLATIQVNWSYLWLTRPYVITALYEGAWNACRFRAAA